MGRSVCLLLFLACAGAAAQFADEAWLCDVLPLAVGNSWYIPPPPHIIDGTSYFWQIVDEFTFGEFQVYYAIYFVDYGGWSYKSGSLYLFFLNGWLYGTPNRADLDSLPNILPTMAPILPEVLHDGQHVTGGHEYTLIWPGTYTVNVQVFNGIAVADLRNESTSILLQGGIGLYIFRLTEIILGERTCYVDYTVAGSCGGVLDATATASRKLLQVGDPLMLNVDGAFSTESYTYQWRHDGTNLPNATDAEFVIPSVAVEDSGSYTCAISSLAKASYETPPLAIKVVTQLPAATLGALSALTLALAALGRIRIRR